MWKSESNILKSKTFSDILFTLYLKTESGENQSCRKPECDSLVKFCVLHIYSGCLSGLVCELFKQENLFGLSLIFLDLLTIFTILVFECVIEEGALNLPLHRWHEPGRLLYL